MNLATVEKVVIVEHHPNADKLDIIKVLGYHAIVGRDQYKVGDLVVFVQPDSILPSDKAWCQDLLRYTSKGRLRAVRLRGEWSMGLVVGMDVAHDLYTGVDKGLMEFPEGYDVTDLLGITKYEPTLPKNMQARGGLPFDIPKTDEERWQNLRKIEDFYGKDVDVTLKIDGSSATFYCVLPGHHPSIDPWGEPVVGLCSRSLELKMGVDEDGKEYNSKWHEAERRYNILEKLRNYCVDNGVSLALRGEIFGEGIQGFAHNPHAKGPVDFAAFSVYNIHTREYERLNDDHYVMQVAAMLGIPTVPLLETGAFNDTRLTQELIDKYDHELKSLDCTEKGGIFMDRFEGVVVNFDGGSFKIINKWYDSDKE